MNIRLSNCFRYFSRIRFDYIFPKSWLLQGFTQLNSMKACHSSEVICHDDDHRHHLHYQNHRQPHIGNVPRRLESESDTTATERDRKSWGWFHSNRNNKGNSIIGFRHKKLPLLAQVSYCQLKSAFCKMFQSLWELQVEKRVGAT